MNEKFHNMFGGIEKVPTGGIEVRDMRPEELGEFLKAMEEANKRREEEARKTAERPKADDNNALEDVPHTEEIEVLGVEEQSWKDRRNMRGGTH